MDELIDILNQDGSSTGQTAPKSEVHSKGYYHNTVHIWFYTEKGEILLQQRSLKKAICPGLWDVSAAGHVDAGETVEEAAVREVYEELGLSITMNDLNPVGVFPCFQSYPSGIKDNEFHNTFICKLDHSLTALKFPPEEVENIKLVSIKGFEELLENSENNNHFVASNRPYYHKVLDKIKSKLCL